MQRKISVNLGNLLLSLSEITDIANPYIAQHQHRTAFIALEIAKHGGVAPETVEKIFTAALLHDIGAVSIEEKIELHNFRETNYDFHCIRGEMFLERTPWFRQIAPIVRHHHKNWSDWRENDADPIARPAQIVLLADYVERLVNRDQYILHQNKEIVEKVKELKDWMVNAQIVDYFVAAAQREEFWLDLVCPRLYPLLLRYGPYRNTEIDLQGIAMVAEVFRDIIDFKSRFTATHTSGVAACAEKLAVLFGLTDLEVSLMKVAGNLHDIGKLVVPNSILEKPDKLTPTEFAVIRSHTYYTYYVIQSIGGLHQVAEWAGYHHEKLNGHGYPFHCKAEEIDTGARIMMVADIFTAIAEDRPYRPGMNREEIYRTLRSMADGHFIDARIVALLFDNYDTVYEHVRINQASVREFYDHRFQCVIQKSRDIC